MQCLIGRVDRVVVYSDLMCATWLLTWFDVNSLYAGCPWQSIFKAWSVYVAAEQLYIHTYIHLHIRRNWEGGGGGRVGGSSKHINSCAY